MKKYETQNWIGSGRYKKPSFLSLKIIPRSTPKHQISFGSPIPTLQLSNNREQWIPPEIILAAVSVGSSPPSGPRCQCGRRLREGRMTAATLHPLALRVAKRILVVAHKFKSCKFRSLNLE
ncbi:Anamorsin [Folsomia candida]|uniref:Anamorsin n=1 Tax=Folsomia candida TaxID=158441 RepID=A0A226EUI0_FOLCA|nr:Anamorsin [Folsomia candida]